jgi:hypothetical protein
MGGSPLDGSLSRSTKTVAAELQNDGDGSELVEISSICAERKRGWVL